MIEKLVLYRSEENKGKIQIMKDAFMLNKPVLLNNLIGEGQTAYMIIGWQEVTELLSYSSVQLPNSTNTKVIIELLD